MEELVKILKLSPDYSRICKARPIGCCENAVFVVDTTKLKNYDDYNFDDLRSFRNHGSKTFVVITEENEVVNIEQERNSANVIILQENQLLLKKNVLGT